MKMHIFGRLPIATLFVATALTGCLSKSNKSTVRLDQSTITFDAGLSDAEKSEKLALAGEQLITPSSFMHADFLFELALKYDSSNIRAQFYKAFLGPKMALKGSLAKTKYIYSLEPKSKADYDEFLTKLPNSEIRNFLTDSTEVIRTEKSAQVLLTDVYDQFDKFRLFLKANKNMDLTLNLNPLAFTDKIQEEENACEVEVVGEGVYDLTNCRYDDLWEAKLDRADIEALQHMTAGIQLYLTAYIAYDLSGLNDVRIKFQDLDVDDNVLFRTLLQNKDFGVLRDPRFFANIKGMGLDYVSAARWAANLQEQLCANESTRTNQRRGKLFHKGLCLFERSSYSEYSQDTGWTKVYDETKEEAKDNFLAVLNIVETVVSGKLMTQSFGENDEYETEIKYGAIIENPIKDLRDLDLIFNDCGDVARTIDPTLNGMFPNSDANYILSLDDDCN
jgi:hypothetical protein